MNSNVIASDKLAVVASINPGTKSANTYTTPWIPLANFTNFMATICLGTMSTNSTVDAKIEQAQDNAGTGAKDVDGKAITQLTQAGVDDSDKQSLINLHKSQVDVANKFTHIRVSLTVGTADSEVCALLQAMDPRYSPASNFGSTSVSEVVN